jgi:hypothetical protein
VLARAAARVAECLKDVSSTLRARCLCVYGFFGAWRALFIFT